MVGELVDDEVASSYLDVWGNERPIAAEVRSSLLKAMGPARKARFDPMTGQPISDETEIPIDNLNSAGEATRSDPQRRRNRLIGFALIGIGGFVLLNMLFGPGFGRILFPLLMVAAGVLIVRRGA